MKSGTARSDSSCRIRVVTLDWTRCSRSAARVTPPSRTTALKICRSDKSIHLSLRSIVSQLFIIYDRSLRVKTTAQAMVCHPLSGNTEGERNVEGLLDCTRLGPGRAEISRISGGGRPRVPRNLAQISSCAAGNLKQWKEAPAN